MYIHFNPGQAMGLCSPAWTEEEAWKGEFPVATAELLPEPSGYCKF